MFNLTSRSKMSAVETRPWLRALTAGLAVALFLSPVIFSHGGEHHEDEKSLSNENSTRNDSLTIIKDSVFVSIDAGFDRLTPIFENSCFNCHSDKTDYPWYHSLPIARQIIDDDIKDARRHLDMSDGFPFGGHAGPADDLQAIKDEVDEGDMPPLQYRLMHWHAKPSSAQADSIRAWVDSSLAKLATVGITPTPEKDDDD